MNMVSVRGALDRDPPAPEAQGLFDPPTIHATELDHGLRCWGIENSTVPVITLSWLAPAGSRLDPEGLEGLASLVSPLVLEGTHRKSGHQILEGARTLGSRILTGFDWDGAFLSFDCLEEDLDRALELATEAALTPVFPEAAVEGWRRRRIVQVTRRMRDPNSLLQDLFASAVYGRGTYGRSMLGSEESLRRITREDLREFHGRHFGPDGAFVLAVGVLQSNHMVGRVGAALANCGWQPREVRHQLPAPASSEAPPLPEGPRVAIADFAGAAQSILCIGHASVPRSHPDIAYLDLLNAVLAGMYTSRLNLELRERLGYTYEIRSQLGERCGPAPFTVRVAVAHENVGESVRVILEEMERLRQEPVSAEELSAAQGLQRGRVLQRFQNAAWILRQMHRQATFGLDDGYERRYQEEIAAIDRFRLMEKAREHLHPDRAVIAVVGPKKEINLQLAPWIEYNKQEDASNQVRERSSGLGGVGERC